MESDHEKKNEGGFFLPSERLPRVNRKDFYAKYEKISENKISKTVSGELFEVDGRYEILDEAMWIGGKFVSVIKDNMMEGSGKIEERFALWKMKDIFEHSYFARKALRDLKIMRLLKHENILQINHVVLPDSREKMDNLYAIMDFMDTDLQSVIRSPQILTDEHVQFTLYAILRGLKYIHSAGVIHRNLRPEKILINRNCDVKIAGFHQARVQSFGNVADGLTDEIGHPAYRAVEVSLGNDDTKASDMWSVGCIFAELLKRTPIFRDDFTIKRLQRIFQFITPPSEEEIQQLKSEKTRDLVSGIISNITPVVFTDEFPGANPQGLDLLRKMLTFSSATRITVEAALQHSYFEGLHLLEDEPARKKPLNPIDFEFERHGLGLESLKDMIYEEALLYNSKDFFAEYKEKKREKLSLIDHILLFRSGGEDQTHQPWVEYMWNSLGNLDPFGYGLQVSCMTL